MSVLVSVNCVTYNHEKYIRDAIEGVLKQVTDFDFEFLIGEDCSTDSTRKIVEEYVLKYPEKIRMITSEKNVGHRLNNIRLHDESIGKYVAICEGDDYWVDPYKLQKQVDYLENNPECTFSFHNAYTVNARKEKIEEKNSLIKKNNPFFTRTNNYDAGEVTLLGVVPTSSFIYRKELLDNPPDWYYTAVVRDMSVKFIATYYGYAHYFNESMGVYRVGVKDSLTDKWRQDRRKKEIQIELNKGFIQLLDNFNHYSGNKFKENIDKSKIPFEIMILSLEENKDEIKNEKYKDYLDKLGVKEKVVYYARINFPKPFAFFARMKASR
ncbi:glycosyltransferase [Sporosarcina siberiensis]|uniref:Glycosyltransferase n=1 Tax=Sporosarcina siberiensis TaxID=1365606 RepID=A0ABW4SDW5_9BACL